MSSWLIETSLINDPLVLITWSFNWEQYIQPSSLVFYQVERMLYFVLIIIIVPCY